MLDKFIEQLISKINEYKKIALFIHAQPDFDCFASAFSLKKWIELNYKDKQVFLMIPKNTYKNSEVQLFFSDADLPSISDLQESIGIILDTSTEERILTQMHIHCQELLIIDHHPKQSNFAQLEFIDPTYSSNSQILAEIFFKLEKEEGKIFDSEMAQFLYSGILTDTGNLMLLSVAPSTFVIVSKLLLKGINRALVHNTIFVQTIKQKLFCHYVLKKSKMTKNGLLYSIVDAKTIKKYEMQSAPNIVSNLANVFGIEVWTTLHYDFDIKQWKCSIRSRELQINTIAKQFGGGGHKHMAATTFKRKRDFYKLIDALEASLKNSGFRNVTKNHRFNSTFYLYFQSFFKKFLKQK